MTLTQLRYAVAVDAHRHFGQAAAACHVSQPTLSAQLQKLEEELGVHLFDRARKPVRPTDLGRQLLEQARVVLRETDRLQDLVAEASGAVAGELRLGVIPTLAPYLLPLVAGPFATRYPAVTVTVRELRTEQVVRELALDRLDAGLIATAEPGAGLASEPLFTESFVAYVGSSHRLASAEAVRPDELNADDLWLLREGHCFRDQVLAVCGAGPPSTHRPLRFESGNLETLRMLVDAWGGMTLLPALALRHLGPAERSCVRPFRAPAPQRTVRLVRRHAYLKRTLIDAYRQTVQAVVQPLLEG